MLPFFEGIEGTALAQLIRTSLWLFPVIEAAHLLALCAIGGALITVDLRLLGAGLTRTAIPDLAREARPWLMAGVAAMLATGTLLFVSEAVKCYHNPFFRVKMSILPVALLFTFLVRQRVARGAQGGTSMRTRVTALVSLALWLGVAIAGRWIGFSS
ncbi:MAG: hypothetical protein H7066_15720 [Cytophagaceae bacterium]|nr:hypothetical protein [Gemmatimonadaceae bacterium]